MSASSPSPAHGLSASSRPTEETVKDYLCAAALHNVAAVRFFIERIGLHPDASFGGKPSALCYAVLKPHHGLLDYLLRRGADVSLQDAMAMTPLHYAAMGGCHCCLARLIAAGAPLNAVNYSGLTPLGLTLGKQHLAGIRTFLECHGAGLEEGQPQPKRFH